MSDYVPDLTQRYPEGFNPPSDYEPTPEEDYKINLDFKIYREKLKCLSGEPSEVAKGLKEYWDSKEPKREDYDDYNKYVYACYDYGKDKTLDIIDKICQAYELTSDSDWNSFYGIKPNTFGIDVEYTDGLINHAYFLKNEKHLDYETFKNVFRDLYYLGMYPSMSYQPKDESKKKLLLSNCSLGELRIYDLKLAGVETEETIKQSLDCCGFNEQKIKEEFDREWRCDINA